MKNIHVLPTDKPSRLHLWTDENGTRLETCELEYSHTRNTQNIYITSDEEIRKGDWYMHPNNFSISQYGNDPLTVDAERKASKKIILTTNQDLIADGVQAIDDEFLEWFVKNPSCEEVEVKKEKVILGEVAGTIYTDLIYKIIIPKEEFKHIPYTGKVWEPPKQETFEELAKNTTKKYINEREKQTAYLEFINGYKLAKEQDKKMYSEEDLENAFFNGWIYAKDIKYTYKFPEAKKEWFDNIKKK